MTSRLSRFGKAAIGVAAPAATYLYTHPEAREPVRTALLNAANTVKTGATAAAPYVRSAIYISPRKPENPEEELQYLTRLGLLIDEAKAKYGTDLTKISPGEMDNLLKEIYDRASYFALKKGKTVAPTTIGEADVLFKATKKTWSNTAGEWTSKIGSTASSAASTVSSAASGAWSRFFGKKNETKPLQGGKRRSKARRSKHRGSRSRRNRSRRN